MQNIRYSSCLRALPGENMGLAVEFFYYYFDCLQALNHLFQLSLPFSIDFKFSLCHLHIILNQKILSAMLQSLNCEKFVK